MTVIAIAAATLETVSKGLERVLEEMKIRGRNSIVKGGQNTEKNT